MRCVAGVVLFFGLGLAFAAAAPLKVDFSIAGRPDSVAPGYEQWFVTGGMSATQRFGELTATLALAGQVGKGLRAVWWKGAVRDGARLVADGVTIEGGDAGGALELRLAGLAPGRHRLVVFLNVTDGKPADLRARTVVAVAGGPSISVAPSFRAADDEVAQTVALEFEAVAGEDAVIQFKPDPADAAATVRNVVLNGFALDVTDPKRRAIQARPAHEDEHVAADGETLKLAWTPANGAVQHRVYFGRSATTLALLGETPSAEQSVSNLRPTQDYFWRIDTVDVSGVVTPGDTWRFRPRQLAFPGAQGAGRFAQGGRGGRVIEVTTLADSGPGSLRAAVEASGPRTVVFALGGLITLERKLVATNPYLTVAGQTAPGPGVTIRKFGFGLSGASDTIIRHLRVRPGDIAGVTLDGMGMQGSNHSIIDHASISWTLDEAFSSRSARNITLQNTLISEALNAAGHKNYKPGTQHGYAASIGGDVGSFHHNLLAHNSGRNWSLAGGLDGAGRHAGSLDIRNNVVYNWQNRATDGGAAQVNFVGNYYKPGPATKLLKFLNPQLEGVKAFGPQRYFVAENVLEGVADRENQAAGMTKPAPYAEFLSDAPLFASDVETQSARAAYKIVLSDVGANQPALDRHDFRIIGETLAGAAAFKGSKTGLPGLPDSQADVGGWEAMPTVARPVDWDSDRDGLPDWWERISGSNPASAAGDFSDSNRDRLGDGITELEHYLNWMAAPHAEVAAGGNVILAMAPLTRGFTAKPNFKVVAAVAGDAVLTADGQSLVFTPKNGFTGIGSVTFRVSDADGDQMTRTIGVRVF
jgi:hypothetical protein